MLRRLLLPFFFLPVLAAAQEPSAERSTLLAALRGAAYSRPAGAGPVQASALELPYASAGLADLVRAEPELEPDDRRLLAGIIRLRLAEEVFVFGRLLDAGDYRIGLGAEKGLVFWQLRGRDGRVLARTPRLVPEEDEGAGAFAVTDRGFFVGLDLVVGEQDVGFDLLPRSRHDEILGQATSARRGRIRIGSDRVPEALLRQLAAELDAGLEIQAGLLGRALDDDSLFDIHLLADRERWLDLEEKLGEGLATPTYGFSAPETNRAYCDAAILENPGRPAPDFVPLILRHTLHHELHHLLAARLRPEGEVLWPTWLVEGLADLAAERALEAGRPGLGAEQLTLTRAILRAAIDSGCFPEPADLLGEGSDSDPPAWYGVARLLTEELAGRRVGGLPALLDDLRERAEPREARARLLEILQQDLGGPGAALRRLRSLVPEEGEFPAVVVGYIDRFRGAWHLSAEEGGALMLLPARQADDARFALEARFAWDDEEPCRLDFVLARHEGRHCLQALVLVVAPDRLALESWTEASVEELDATALATPLESGTADALAWHALRIDYDRDARRLSVRIDDREPIRLGTKRYFPVVEGRIGFGLDERSALFELPRLLAR